MWSWMLTDFACASLPTTKVVQQERSPCQGLSQVYAPESSYLNSYIILLQIQEYLIKLLQLIV